MGSRQHINVSQSWQQEQVPHQSYSDKVQATMSTTGHLGNTCGKRDTEGTKSKGQDPDTGLRARTSSDMQSPLIARKSHYGQDQSPCKDQSKVAMQMDYIRSTHQVPKDTTMMTLESAVSSSQAQHTGTGTGMSLSEQSP